MKHTLFLLLALFLTPLTSHATQIDPPSLEIESDPGDEEMLSRSWEVVWEATRLVKYADRCSSGGCSERDLVSAELYAEALYEEAVVLDERLARFESRSLHDMAAIFSARVVMRTSRHALDFAWGPGLDPQPYEQWCCGWPPGVKPSADTSQCIKWCCKWEIGDPGQTCNDFKGDCTGTTDNGCNFFACNCSFSAG